MTQQEDSTNTVEVQQQEPQTTNDVVSNESIQSNNKVEEPVASESNPSLVEQPSSEVVVEEVKREETVVEEEEKKEVMPDDQVEEVKTEVHEEQAPPVQPSTEVEQVAEKEESTTTTTEAPSVVEQSTLVVEEVAPQDNTEVNVSDVVLTETTIVETVVVQPVASEEKIEVVPQPSTETIIVEAKEPQQQTTATTATTAFVKDSNIDENSHYGIKLKVEIRAPKVDVKKQSADIGGGIRRKATDTDGLVYRKNANIATCYDSLQNAIKKYPNNKALGHRPMVNGVAGDYVWMTYSQLGERLANFSSGLANLGIQPSNISVSIQRIDQNGKLRQKDRFVNPSSQSLFMIH